MDSATARIRAQLASLVDYERVRPGRLDLSLEPMRRLMALAVPPIAAQMVQIGGSKGKGTTARYLEMLAEAAGIATGVYASPHVQSVLERVRIRGDLVDESLLRRELEVLLDCVRRGEVTMTFFEAMTAAALRCFAVCDVELGVLEVGLGGRFDATTAVDVDASIVTTIELEHTEWLGDTVRAIATEKSFVLRPNRPAWTTATGEALDVLRRRAADVDCGLAVYGRDFGVDDLRSAGAGWTGTLFDGDRRVPFELDRAPFIEIQALAAAWACLGTLRPELEHDRLRLERPLLPGRFEVVSWGGQPLVLDGAHTNGSLAALADELDRQFPGRPRAVVFGCAAGKQWREGLSRVARSADSVVVTGLADTRSEDPEAICAWLRQRGVRARAVPDVAAALNELVGFDGVRVVTGSFYLVGEARTCLPLDIDEY